MPEVFLQLLEQPAQHKHWLATHYLLTKVEDIRLVNVTALAKGLSVGLYMQQTEISKAKQA